jgi:phosphoribosylanthranilate isomerase
MRFAPKIKFCGMTRPDDAELAVELGVWAVGMVFHPDSPRRCPHDAAIEIGAMLKRRCEVAGVFHNANLDTVTRIARDVGLTLVQLHGDEGPAYCEEVARRTGCKVIKAARVKSTADVLGLRVYRTDYHLLDTHVSGLPGGTGETFPWEYALRHEGPAPYILAGGLNPANVAEAITAAKPFAVDVASGIESSPGIKSETLMRDFADAVASTGPQAIEQTEERAA